MGNLLRLVFMIGMLVAVALASALQQPEWAHDLGLDPWIEAALPPELRSDPEQERDFEQRDQALKKRIAVKEACIQELIAGRITLFEAAARFRRANEEYPVVPDFQDFVSESPEERLCQQVIQWTRVTLRSCPSTASADLVEQLEQELRRHKEPNGAIRLPANVLMP